MFSKILQFELRYWLKQPMVYVFMLIVALLVFGAVSSDNITIGSSFSNIKKNAPFVVLSLYAFMSLLVLLMVTAFAQSSALRDFNHDTHQIIFSTPMKKFPYLAGRFAGAFLVALIPILGVSLGILIGAAAPWLDPERVVPVHWAAHFQGFVLFGLVNTFFIAAVIFSIAALTRSTIASFVGAIALLVGYAIAGSLLQDIENEQLGMLIDPFGIGTFSTVTKYWTVADKNEHIMGWGGMMLLNRLLWIGVTLLILAFTFWRFDFSLDRRRKKKKQAAASDEESLSAVPSTLEALPTVQQYHHSSLHWRQMLNQSRIDFLGIVKSLPFLMITLFGIANMTGSMLNATSFYGLTTHPVTYNVVGIIRGTMYLFTFGILVFYSGELVWKERNANVDQIYDALPHPNWVTTLSKILAMMGVLGVLQVLGIITGVIAQAGHGYTNFELGIYFKELIVLDLLAFLFLVVLSMLIHTLVNNKYIGYFAFVVFFILNLFIWQPLEIQSVMVRFGQTPNYTYSDMNGFGPFVPQLVWFNLYWFFFATLLAMAGVLLWVRGKDNALSLRVQNARRQFSGTPRYLSFALAGAWLIVAGYVYYNTQILNPYDSVKVAEKRQVEYERKYKAAYEDMLQPHVTDVDYTIDIYPEQRDLSVRGEVVLINLGDQPIDTLFINTNNQVEMELDIERADLVRADEDLQVQFYHLNPALQPGDSLRAVFTTEYRSEGYENQVSFTKVVPNGTFFNNQDVTPLIGYQPARELTDKNERKDYGLPDRQPMPTLTRDCTEACMHNYLSNFTHWVNTETVISTTPDQIAVAPGSLIEEWEENDRRYFRYRLDHPSLGFYSFISADYEVIREKWKGIDVEVYYHEAHPYNVDKMVNSIKKSLGYYTEHFSPYRHRQARIIEFPRYASFAQAFPGTMPYSESIGFIARIEDEADIDMVFYVVAHEMAHQWWAHQAMSAAVEGATLLVETLAQYSAVMVMEKEYGKDKIHKFLKYEMDNYLRSRGNESRKEKPLLRVDAGQGYIHYRKGSAVMYYLKEMIGEDNLNAALRDYLDAYAYAEPPYPTAYALVDRIRERTPDSLQYLITDLFEEITLFDNRIAGDPQVEALDNGQYKVTMEVEFNKLRADSLGAERSIDIQDYIDFGVYAKPEGEEERGRTLALERRRITAPKQTISFIVGEEPYEAGVDPNYFLIDRMPEDNVKRVKGL